MDKSHLLNKEQSDLRFQREQDARKANGEPLAVMPDETGPFNSAAIINPLASHSDPVREVIEDGEHPFRGNANNMRVAQRIAATPDNTVQAPLVLTPQQAAKEALAKAAAFGEVPIPGSAHTTAAEDDSVGDDDGLAGDDGAAGTGNTVLPQQTPQQKAAATKAKNAAAAAAAAPPVPSAPPAPAVEGAAPPLPAGAAPTFVG